MLAKYINSEEEVDAVEMTEPYTYLNGLTIKDLEDLVEDIKVSNEMILAIYFIFVSFVNFPDLKGYNFRRI